MNVMPYTQGNPPAPQGSAGMGHTVTSNDLAVANDYTATCVSDTPPPSVMEEACQTKPKN